MSDEIGTREVRARFVSHHAEGARVHKEHSRQVFNAWHAAEIAAAEKRGAEQAIRDAAERVKRTLTGETHYESLQEHADMIRDDEVDWRKPIDRMEGE